MDTILENENAEAPQEERLLPVVALGAAAIRIPCRIETIRPLDVKALKQAQRELREARMVEREATG